MRYLENPKRRDPRRLLPSAKSVICVGLIYNTDYPYSTEVGGEEFGSQESETRRGERNGSEVLEPARVSSFESQVSRATAWISRYAWGRDYHEVMRPMLEEFCAALEAETPGTETRAYVDTGPIVERAFARYSGLGWTGKNTCLINQEKGSWFFLGVILTSLELEPDLPAPDRCGSCTRCLEACPTGALIEPYVMDASRCISYLTIELKRSIPEEFRPAIGANIFGCDICQDVCPWNSRQSSVVSGQLKSAERVAITFQPSAVSPRPIIIETTGRPEFQPMVVKQDQASPEDSGSRGKRATDNGQRTTDFSLFKPSLDALAALTAEDFRRIFCHSAIKRAKYRGWLRNLCVAMGNSGNRRFIPWLEEARKHSEAVVREHAEWALEQLKGKEVPRSEGNPPAL